MVDIESGHDGFSGVVWALHQVFTGNVVFASYFGWVEFDVVSATAGWVGATTAHALNNGVVGHVNFHYVVYAYAGLFHGLGLRYGARKPVE